MKLVSVLLLGSVFTVLGYRMDPIGAPPPPQLNCVARCVQMYRMCIRSGENPADCAAEREACKEDCVGDTCEPGMPGCCGTIGMPDCP
jgi:hypothetical protein